MSKGIAASDQVVHSVTVQRRFILYLCSCDFCGVMTPPPTPADLDAAALDERSTIIPCIEPGFLKAAVDDAIYAPFGKNFRYRPAGWQLLGEKWACEKCFNKAVKFLEKR